MKGGTSKGAVRHTSCDAILVAPPAEQPETSFNLRDDRCESSPQCACSRRFLVRVSSVVDGVNFFGAVLEHWIKGPSFGWSSIDNALRLVHCFYVNRENSKGKLNMTIYTTKSCTLAIPKSTAVVNQNPQSVSQD